MTLTPRRLLSLILVGYLLLAFAYSAVVPLGEAPDEVSHIAYVRWLATRHTLPEPEGAVLGEAFQPPLYYALVAPLTAWQPDDGVPVVANPDWELRDPTRGVRVLLQPPAARWPWHGEALAWHLARFLSPLLGLVTVLATYALARLVLPEREGVGPLAAAFVAFLPQFTFQSGVVSNDNLITMLGALLLAVLASALVPHERGRVGRWALAGLLGGLSVWSKTSGWVFVGTAGLAWLMTWQEPRRWQRLVALGGTWLLVALPWLLWNLVTVGDPLGWSLMHQVTDARVGPLTPRLLLETFQGLYRTFWAGFGGAAHLSFPPLLNALLGALVLGALAGLVRMARRRAALPASSQRLLLWLGVHAGLVGSAWLQWTRTVLGTGQGRLIFPALPAIAVLLAAGWLAWLRPARRAAQLGSAALALFGGLTLFGFLRPLYVAPPPVQAAGTSVEAAWRFGEGLRLQRYSFPWTDAHLPPGSRDDLYLEWESSQPLPDLRVRLHLVDRDGTVVWSKEGTPSAGRDSADQWATATPVGVWHRIEVPSGTAPGWYRLLISVVQPDGSVLPLYGPDGTLWGEQVMVGQFTVTTGE